ncbi:MAG: CPBP family intramembrane metalloprotease [Rhodospirillales bacterium]|nr:CPBP family intramembrane metalloprotease [Rhodospirillales bacterium]
MILSETHGSRNIDAWAAAAVLLPLYLITVMDSWEHFEVSGSQWFWIRVLMFSMAIIVAISYGPFQKLIRESLQIRNRSSDPQSVFKLRISLYSVLALIISLYIIPYLNGPVFDYFTAAPTVGMDQMSTLAFLLEIIIGLTCGAFAEEICNRVVIRKAIENFTSSHLVLYFLSSLLFALGHISAGIPSFTSAFLFGNVVMFLYVRTG